LTSFLVFDRGSFIGTYSSGETNLYAVSKEYIQRIIVPQIKTNINEKDDGFWLHIQDIDLDFKNYPFKMTFEMFVSKTHEEQKAMAEEWLTIHEDSFCGANWSVDEHGKITEPHL
jgi:hypothetical protein